MPHQHMIRVQRRKHPDGSLADDVWLRRLGDKATLDVPGGRVTLELSGGWSESGSTAFCRLSFEPIREGLTQPPTGTRADYIEREVFGVRHPVRRRFLRKVR